MEGKLLSSLGKIAGIAGIALGVFVLLFQGVLQQKFLPIAGLGSSQAFAVIMSLMLLTFGVAGIGVFAWLISLTTSPEQPVPGPVLAGLAALITLVIAAAVYIGAQARPDLQPKDSSSLPTSIPSASNPTSPLATPVASAPASKVEIGNFYHRENGCHSSPKTTRFPIQNSDKLDRTHPGTIQGVTVEVYAGNGGVISDAHFESPNVFVVTGTATGGGHWVDGLLGGGTCVGATGADIGAHIYGFFH